MALINWDPKYSVNIREIDRQHQKLFGLLNDLHDAMKEGRGRTLIGKVLGELVEYTVYHFQTEEKLFQEHLYTNATAHRAEHRALTDKAQTLRKKFDAGQVQVTHETLGFLRDWINGHIMGSDKNYSEFLNAKGVV